MVVTRGRRPAGSGTREAILAAASRAFAEQGYPRTTLRAHTRHYFAKQPPTKTFTNIQLPPIYGVLSGINNPAGEAHYSISDSIVRFSGNRSSCACCANSQSTRLPV